MHKFVWIVLTAFTVFSCRTKAKRENVKQDTALLKLEMLEADRNFSAMSEEKGLRNAFIEFIDSNGVLLRPGTLPLKGGDAMDMITQSNDSTLIMTWEPRSASIAASGELGYTYGVYSVKQKDEDTIIYGSYVTIWKRQPNGSWKFILQSGNEGVE